ncbi:MAG: glycoside hydrolase family 3 protein [Chloroflexia bacterium]
MRACQLPPSSGVRCAPSPGKAPYRNPHLPVPERVEDLLARMTLEEKIGQMTLVEKGSIRPEEIGVRCIGALLSGGGSAPPVNSPEAWANMVNGFQEYALHSRLGIPLLYGVDAVHGHGNVYGATIFPHNIGLGATRDPELVERIARATAEEMAATGTYWNYAPVVAVPQDIRWGRTYEGFGEQTDLVCALGSAYVRGLHDGGRAHLPGTAIAVLATPKHFVGDGGTAWDSSHTFNIRPYRIDQGDTRVDEATLRAVHLPPYVAALEAGARCIMVSLSSWQGTKMHAHRYLLTDVLKRELGFQGFLVSDWEGVQPISQDYDTAVVTAINAGIDMVMVPCDYPTFIGTLKRAVERGDVPLARIDDAVRRILTAKFLMGLFERPYAETSLLPAVGSAEHRELAREAVRKSLVLLKNDGVLPLARNTPRIFIAGPGADDIGMQCGGWTIEWQGKSGNITPGTTLLQAIRQAAPGSAVHHDRWGRFDGVVDDAGRPSIADVGIGVVGEMPYAEGLGDREDLSLSPEDLAVLGRLRQRCRKMLVILLSGRPVLLTDAIAQWDAFVAAWLPGSEGQGVADVLFGDFPFHGQLPYAWPRNLEQVPRTAGHGTPLFPFGYGLR